MSSCKFIIFLVLFFPSLSFADAGNPYSGSCQLKGINYSKKITKEGVYSFLNATEKEVLIQNLFAELYSKKNNLALPISLYLGNVEVDEMMRGFWLLIATIVSEGQNPEQAYKNWPKYKGIDKFPIDQVTLCRKYREAIDRKSVV